MSTFQVAYANDLSGEGKVESLRKWYNGITEIGTLFGYHAELTKSWIIVKGNRLDEAKATFKSIDVNKLL